MHAATGLSVSFSISAEEKIIYPLFNLEAFEEDWKKRLITQYPSSDFDEKTAIVKRLLKSLWDDAISADKENSVFDEFEKFDKVLSIIGVRGHFIHQFEVFLLGLFLIKFILKDGEVPLGFKDFNEVVDNWLVASTAHDFGYPIEKGPKGLSEIGDMYEQFGFSKISSQLKKCSYKITSLRKKELDLILHEQDKTTNPFILLAKTLFSNIGNDNFLTKFLNDQVQNSSKLNSEQSFSLLKSLEEKFDHGYVSSYILVRLFKKNNINNATIVKKYGKAIGAIILHNADPLLFNNELFCYKSNPLALILFIIDNIQDWSRDMLKNDSLSTCRLSNITTLSSPKTINFEFLLSHKTWEMEVQKTTRKWLSGKVAKIKNVTSRGVHERIILSLKYLTSKGEIFYQDEVYI